ncbi:MAG: hypothetical protein LBS03_02730 [Bacteroidales bacterium]|jgi:hypothetical protein|nr:hypothetical protein [Bacteroidales bacterium]
MKKIVFLRIVAMFVLVLIMGCSNEAGRRKPVQVELLSNTWRFTSGQPAQSVLTAQAPQAGLTMLIRPDGIELSDIKIANCLNF